MQRGPPMVGFFVSFGGMAVGGRFGAYTKIRNYIIV